MLLVRRQSVAYLVPLLVFCFATTPALAQGTGSVPPGEASAPDPGFEHNQVGRNIGSVGSLPDTGNYCGPLPAHVCYGGGYYFVLNGDPYAPSVWARHSGNSRAAARSAKKGWPLQTLTVLLPNGDPAINAEVRFFESGYAGRGIRGATDQQGRFQVAVKRDQRSHRFLIEMFGFEPARLDVVGSEFQNAEHRIRLQEPGRYGRTRAPFRRIAVIGDTALPARLAKDYRRAVRAVDKQDWKIAITELTALVERWPIGTLEDGEEYRPQELLIAALEGAGEALLASEVKQRSFEVVEAKTAG